jgi:uncharacterized protein YecE (DUF72 family)
MGEVLLGCSGWNYPDTADKGGWTGVFYPNKDTKRLRYYSQFFNTAEMDSSFYDRFYSQMTKGTFIGMSRATPEKFQFSIKVPETMSRKSIVTIGGVRSSATRKAQLIIIVIRYVANICI